MPDYDVDVTTCDMEPIHLIGEIQSYGALIAVDETDLVIRHVSANAGDILGQPAEDLLGKPIDDLVAGELSGTIDAIRSGRRDVGLSKLPSIPSSADAGDAAGNECLIHRNAGSLILEFFPPLEDLSAAADRIQQHLISELAKPGSIEEIATLGAQLCRAITGYDRVMVYRFHDDLHGEVIAEHTDREERFFGLHYPASDIPAPARRHFLLNAIRIVGDVDSETVPLLPARDPETGRPLDLTYSRLRAVSPFHIGYLKNMGVGASMSISLVVNDKLWGLVSCHHYSPRRLSAADIQVCELLGSLMGSFIQGLENTEALLASKNADDLADELEVETRQNRNLVSLIETRAPRLMALVDAQGIILRCDGRSVSIGNISDPPPAVGQLAQGVGNDVLTTTRLADLIPLDDDQVSACAGGAFISLSEDASEFMFFSREEFAHTVNWAGDPSKNTIRTSDRRSELGPRQSFELWRSTVRGTSRPFSDSTKEALRILRRALFALRSVERERQALQAMTLAEIQKASLQVKLLDAGRRNSLGELASVMAHELNQPLAALVNYINACRQELRSLDQPIPGDVAELMDEAVSEAGRAGDLVRRLRRFIEQGDLEPASLDINDVVSNAARLGLSAVADVDVELRTDLADELPAIWADQVQIEQVVFNLVRNAVEAMKESETKQITVSTSKVKQSVKVSVSDTGPGIPPDLIPDMFKPFRSTKRSGMGIGLSLCRSIVRAHGGQIAASSSSRGAEIAFRLPIRNPEADD